MKSLIAVCPEGALRTSDFAVDRTATQMSAESYVGQAVLVVESSQVECQAVFVPPGQTLLRRLN